MPVPISRQLIIGARPEAAFRIFEEGCESSAPKVGCVAAVVNSKPDSIKSDQTVGCEQPQVSVARLKDSVDRVLGEALIRVPEVKAVLGARSRPGQKAEDKGREPCQETV
jgi:hypothetical protein